MKGINVVSKSAMLFVVGLFLGFTGHVHSKQNEAGNAKTPLANNGQSAQHVVLISLDGFRHDYIELHNAKHLARIAKKGVRAQAMTPVYPANTFPNHISLVTGLLPKHHGIVNNRFYDKSRPTKEGYAQYQLGYGRMDSTWITAVPLWNLAEFHGLKAATFFWPESDARISGALPTYHFHYSKYADYQQRIDQIIQWLSLPEVSRPRFVAGYFSLTDTVGHDEGPTSIKTKQAVQKVDTLVGQLYDRLQALDIDVNLVIVSDHGMSALDESRFIEVSNLGIPDDFLIENEGAQIQLYAREGISSEEVDHEIARLTALANGRFTVLDTDQRRERAMEVDYRTGDILIEIAPPARFVDDAANYSSKGGHGYLNTLPDMGATFVATGPAFKQNKKIGRFKNLELYPALAKVLGIKPISPIDGELDVLVEALTL